jgi:N utilization substance protein B
MISRRLLRIKVLQLLYAYFNSNDEGLARYEKDLFYSIEKSYDLYHLFFVLLLDVKEYSVSRMELGKNKRMPTSKDLSPNLRFIDNRVINQLSNTNKVYQYIDEKKLNWNNYPELIKRVYTDMMESEAYQKYMSSETNTYKEDQKFIVTFFSEFLVNSDLLYQVLEEYSIFWNDDIEFMLSMNVKTVEKAKVNDKELKVFPLFKNDEDKEFAKLLFRMVILKHKENSDLIQLHIKNWDIERVAQMDLLVLEMAITEIMQFTSVPIKVSFNEYIELVKFYSTERSNAFVNGVLDKIINQLKSENKITKEGRGLKE